MQGTDNFKTHQICLGLVVCYRHVKTTYWHFENGTDMLF